MNLDISKPPPTVPLNASPNARFRPLYDVWLESLSVNTRRAYAGDLKQLMLWREFADERELGQIMSAMNGGEANMLALEWRNELIARKLSLATVNRMVAAMKSFLKFLRMNGLITWSIEMPQKWVKPYKDTAGCGPDLAQQVIRDLAQKDDQTSLRDAAIINLIWRLGLRRGEIVALDVAHLDFRRKRILVRGKGRHELELINLTIKMVEVLRSWLRCRGTKDGPLFWNLSRSGLRERLSNQGVWRITRKYNLGRPHGVRHASITEGLEKTGGDVRTMMKFSRHKDLNTLMIYDDNRKGGSRKVSEMLEEDL